MRARGEPVPGPPPPPPRVSPAPLLFSHRVFRERAVIWKLWRGHVGSSLSPRLLGCLEGAGHTAVRSQERSEERDGAASCFKSSRKVTPIHLRIEAFLPLRDFCYSRRIQANVSRVALVCNEERADEVKGRGFSRPREEPTFLSQPRVVGTSGAEPGWSGHPMAGPGMGTLWGGLCPGDRDHTCLSSRIPVFRACFQAPHPVLQGRQVRRVLETTRRRHRSGISPTFVFIRGF